MDTLLLICNKIKSQGYFLDKNDPHSYIQVYENILKPYRETAKNVLEIGLFDGGSLLMWEEYFSKAYVIGIDCDEQPHGGMADLRPLMKDHNIYIMDATDSLQVLKTFHGITLDVIIEDASHMLDHQVKIYNIFKEYLAPDGIYIIEDVDKIDEVRSVFENLDPEREIVILDRRDIKNRYDDCLVIIS